MTKSDSGSFRLVELDEHHAKATAFNMLFTLWCKETRADAYSRAGEVLGQLAEQYPAGVGVLHTVEPDALPPDPVARAELKKFIKLAENWVKHYSVLHEGTGFKAASVRAVASGLYIIARPKYRHDVFSTLTQASAWHSEQQRLLGRSETPQQIGNVVRKLRELHAAYVAGRR